MYIYIYTLTHIYIYIYIHIYIYIEAYAIPPTPLIIFRSSEKGRTWVSNWVVDKIAALSFCRERLCFCLSTGVYCEAWVETWCLFVIEQKSALTLKRGGM